MSEPNKRKVVFLGAPLDCDERQEAIDQKLALAGRGAGQDDPYEQVLAMIRAEVEESRFREEGCLEVPGWLRPIPPPADLDKLRVENFVEFMEQEGCRTAAGALSQAVSAGIWPDIPCLLAVDHSLTGGMLAGLAEKIPPPDLSLIVLDSHLDAMPLPVMAGAIAYDMENNPGSAFDPRDPFLRDRGDAYTASSFLHHLLKDGLVLPQNLFVMGISDYPSKRGFRLKDKRMQAYTGIYSGLRSKGARIVTKAELTGRPAKAAAILGQIKTPYVYISVDMDIGARNALAGVRFDNYQGLNQKQIYRLAQELGKLQERGIRLAGMDVCEFNPRAMDSEDPTYRIAADLIEMVCFNRLPAAS
ncbi:MAG: arginase family protein [Desulfarculaceae bacterium]